MSVKYLQNTTVAMCVSKQFVVLFVMHLDCALEQ